MGFSLTGYVLDPARVGAANSPFTFTPNVLVTDQGAFNTAYPTNESNPRTEYLALVLTDGDLHAATFAWTKNEVLQRFDYDGLNQRFKTLPGSAPTLLGVITSDANTTRLVSTLLVSSNTTTFPIRVSVGSGSGTTFTTAIVANSGAFTLPASGTVQIALDSGELHWNVGDLTTYSGQPVKFQRQSFFAFKDSTGALGLIEDILLLNPKPAQGQFPLIRIGFGLHLTPVERVNEAAFSGNPTAGTVEWARDTGRVKFNSGDAVTNAGRTVYYEGVCVGYGLSATTTNQGTVSAPTAVSPIPSAESDAYFRVPGVVQFAQIKLVDAFSSFGKQGVVEVNSSTGAVQFSIFDQVAYGAQAVQLVKPDLLIERGITLRLFRSPVDLTATDPSIKDVTALHTASQSKLADPLIEAPFVSLPALPVESLSMTLEVTQGTGAFTGTLPNLDVTSPPTGYGYTLDYPNQRLQFARRRSNVVIDGSPRKPYGAVALPDPLVLTPNNAVFELETAPNSGTYAALTIGSDTVLDTTSGVLQLVTTVGELIFAGVAAILGFVLTDTSADFLVDGVVQGDLVIIDTGAAKGVHTVSTVTATTLTMQATMPSATGAAYSVRRGKEVLADRYFKDIPPFDPETRVERVNSLGLAVNSPRRVLPLATLTKYRGRFGKTTFVELTQVANDGAFTAPGSLAAGVVEVSLSTGNLNFSTADAGLTFYSAKTLTLGSDYRAQPGLGFIELTERLLAMEEVHTTYAVVDSDNVKTIVSERGRFLIRKEIVQVHPTPTNTLSFNPLGRELADTPSPSAFRGGRPQKVGTQVTFDTSLSTVTFLPTSQVTDALPSGEVISPDERVYVDYYVYEAVGGEKDLTVLQAPIATLPVVIEEDATSFQTSGDRTSTFRSGRLLKVGPNEVYQLGTPIYDPVSNTTAVNIAAPQAFKSDQRNPTLAVTSGATRVTALPFLPSYFVTELAGFESAPRGSNRLRLVGDRTRDYVPGTVTLWSDGASILDFNLVDGSTYDPTTDRTEVVLGANGQRQYTSGSIAFRRSVRPILATAFGAVSTKMSPHPSQPLVLFRQVEGQTGDYLDVPEDYSIDGSGRIVLSTPLQDNEEISAFYLGDRVISDGRNVRASYTHLAVPSQANGMVGQVLRFSYTTHSPDTFFWRVETLTNFKGELTEKYDKESKATIPTGGPRLSNASTPRLYEQGRESLFFGESRYANEDIVARYTLEFLHDGIEYVEDCLEKMDGRVVGDHDGRFRFDGLLTNPPRATFADVTNQIDDQMKAFSGTPVVTFPPFSVTFTGAYQEAYKASKFSRFFPTERALFGVAADATGLETGDAIVDTQNKPLASVRSVSRRLPWAVVTRLARVGDTVIQVDNADGAEELLRPAFDTAFDLQVSIQRPDGTFLVPDGTPLTVSATTATTLTLSAPLAVAVPVGATIRHIKKYVGAAPADPYLKAYRPGFDVGASLSEGILTHIEPTPPFDGSFPAIPAELEIQNPTGGEVLDVLVEMSTAITEPARFPALDGSTLDDDSNRQFPILSPTANSEVGSLVGYLPQELGSISVGGALRSLTTAPYVGTGSLDATRTIITNSVNWPAPVPKVGDLTRILSGLNAGSNYHRITATTADTITVATAFASVDAGFSFTVAVANTLASGTGTHSTSTFLSDLFASFVVAGVKPGHTLVLLDGVNAGLRRQIITVSAFSLTTEAFPAPTGGAVLYRVDNPLATYGGTGSEIVDVTVPAVQGEQSTIGAQVAALELFLAHFSTTIVSSSTGSTTSGFATFTDLNADFTVVTPGHYIRITPGAQIGFYRVVTIDSPTTVTVEAPFGTTASNISYQLIKVDFISGKSLNDVQDVLDTQAAAFSNANAFEVALTGLVPIQGDPSGYANPLLTSTLDTRVGQITARSAYLTTPGTGGIDILSGILSSVDRLYDKRFTWIDARINLVKGILPLKERAVSDRQKARKDLINQLTKILSVRT